MIVENYIQSWDFELQHSMAGKLWMNYQNLWYIFQIQCLQPHLETLSLWWLISLQLLCPASALAICSHWYSVPQILKGHSSLHSSLCLKSHFGRVFLHSVSNIPPASLLFALYVHMCVCVCVCVQNPFKSFDGKRTFGSILMSVAHKRLPGMC